MVVLHAEKEDDFSARTNAFLSWLQQRPGASLSPKVRIADLRKRGAGRGVVAVDDIRDGEELLKIQLASVLSVENSTLYSLHPEIFSRLDPWNSLILAMIHEDGKEENSRWWPYMNILPSTFDTLIYWQPAELRELQGSAVVNKIGKSEAEESFIQILLPIIQQHSALFGKYAKELSGPLAAGVLTGLAHRMATLIMAYGFDLENEPTSEDDEDILEEDDSSQKAYQLNKGMVPFADLFNADGDLNNAHLLQDDKSMTMVALHDISKGSELFNDFGQLPRSDLLRRYGYVTDRYKQWDVVEIDIEDIKQVALVQTPQSDSQLEQRLQILADEDILQDGYDLCRPAQGEPFQFDEDLLRTIHGLLLPSDIKDVAAHDASGTKIAKSMPVCCALRSIVLKRQSDFSTTIAEDVKSLQDIALSNRHRMAVEVRLGEKEILALAKEAIDQKIATLQQTQPTPEDQADSQSKKRKT